MALSRRTGARFQASIWPGFVDAMTGLLLVLMFVLTIFMVIQFVLRETITGQESRLTELSAEVASLTQALGLERDRSAALGAQVGSLSGDLASTEADLSDAQDQIGQQNALISRLTTERDTQAAALVEAQAQITGFEAQVAGLLAQRRAAQDTIAGLEAAQDQLLSDQDALNLALAQARTEIDAQTEAARLAAARREALDAMIADLEADNTQNAERISELEAARLVDAAAAQALRERLENADTELTAMTLALEEKRREAEETLTLLAAAQTARDDLDQNLAIALLAQQEAQAALEGSRDTSADLETRLAEALAAQAEASGDAEALQARLAEALIAAQTAQTQVATLSDEQGSLQDRLAAAVAALAAAEAGAQANQSEAERRAALLAQANEALSEQEALSAESQRQVALLNEQVATLRAEMTRLQGLLNLAEDQDVAADVQIESLTQDLNTAMARALLAERRARALEEAEAERLAAEAAELQRFRSDFFGQLREVLEGQEGVRIVGDRFVFSSEVLFEQGQAELSRAGQQEIAKVAVLLRNIADEIPSEIDWIIRVDGHTDDVPLSGQGAYVDNWELSQARALSVVRYMSNFLGIPPNRLAANGFGQYQPIALGDSEEARAQNRRIELKLTER